MLAFILWYLLISLAGWLAFPLAFRLLGGLPDRGFAFSRTLGWLVWGFVFWLLGSLGVVHNDAGGILLALLIVTTLSCWALRHSTLEEFTSWLRQKRSYLIGVELLFLLSFAAWAVVRAANPEIYGTEKPMELAFINAILHSPVFPPHDPWLAGYAISYYYFGYVLVAMLAKLSSVTGGVAFNLGIALVFALSAVGAYGVLYNLLAQRSREASKPRPWQGGLALLAPLFVLLVSNLVGLLEVLHRRGLFWRADNTGQLTSSFWKWLDLVELSQPPVDAAAWAPRLFGTGAWWWWRASRVVQDYDIAGGAREIIDEFPFFSYLLADLHPHVLAMPFAFLAMALALNLFLGGAQGQLKGLRLRLQGRVWLVLSAFLAAGGLAVLWMAGLGLNLRLALLGVVGLVVGGFLLVWLSPEQGLIKYIRTGVELRDMSLPQEISPAGFLLSAVVLGGLAFLNTWDFPFYVALFAGAYALSRLQGRSWSQALKDFLGMALAVGACGGLLYLPFYLGFSSQAGVLLPNLIYPTRGAHLWVMFATLFLPLLAFLVYLWWKAGGGRRLLSTLGIALAGVFILWLLSLLVGWLILLLPTLGDYYLGSLAASGRAALFAAALSRRFSQPGGWITLVGLVALAAGVLSRVKTGGETAASPASAEALPRSHAFTLLLTMLGVLLVLGPEFFYLQDQFGWRINTIFKFYYQAWLLLGVAAAYGTAVLLGELHRGWGAAFRIGIGLLLAAGLVYPVYGLWDKTQGFSPEQGWTLDGSAAYQNARPDEAAAIAWLESAPPGVLAEAVSYTGGSYSEYARLSMLSGQPAVLGWIGHESQWRGGGAEMGSRQADIERLYCAKDWEATLQVIRQYGIRYIAVGSLERQTYASGQGDCGTGLNELKFQRYLDTGFELGDFRVYVVP